MEVLARAGRAAAHRLCSLSRKAQRTARHSWAPLRSATPEGRDQVGEGLDLRSRHALTVAYLEAMERRSSIVMLRSWIGLQAEVPRLGRIRVRVGHCAACARNRGKDGVYPRLGKVRRGLDGVGEIGQARPGDHRLAASGRGRQHRLGHAEINKNGARRAPIAGAVAATNKDGVPADGKDLKGERVPGGRVRAFLSPIPSPISRSFDQGLMNSLPLASFHPYG